MSGAGGRREVGGRGGGGGGGGVERGKGKDRAVGEVVLDRSESSKKRRKMQRKQKRGRTRWLQ